MKMALKGKYEVRLIKFETWLTRNSVNTTFSKNQKSL